jgi:Cu2+-exporting ATPase
VLRFSVQGITCAACALEIEWLLKPCPVVRGVRVDTADAIVELKVAGADASLDHFNALLAPAGYQLIPSQDPSAQEQVDQTHRQAWWRLALAMLCMMQVMMYAVPLYWMSPGEIDPSMEGLLRKAAWVLSLPVVLICARPYWKRAAAALRSKRLPMDVSVALGIAVAFIAGTIEAFRAPVLVQGTRDIHLDSLTMFVAFILVAQALEHSMRRTTARRLDRLLGKIPATVQRRNVTGGFEVVDAATLALGDVILIRPGEQVPADGVIESANAQFSEAILTGESGVVQRAQGSIALAGSFCAGHPAMLRVIGLGQDTRLGRMQALMRQSALMGSSVTELTERIAPTFLMVVLGCAALTAAWWAWQDPTRLAGAVAAVLVVSCPCAVVLAAPSARLRAARVAAEHGVVTQKPDAFARLAEVQTVMFDKTGTLSVDEAEVVEMRQASGESADRLLAIAAMLAQYSTHPKSRSLMAYCDQHKVSTVPLHGGPLEPHQITEHFGQGLVAHLTVEQAQALGLVGISPIGQEGVALALGGAALIQGPIDARPEELMLGVVSIDSCGSPFAGSPFVGTQKARWLASWSLQEKARDGAASLVAELQRAAIKVSLLSGDRWQAAQDFAKALGIDQVFAQCSPEDKLACIAQHQNEARVLMVGDGINDAACLAKADASMALGNASALAQSQSDFIITTEKLAAVAWLITLARKAQAIERSNLRWAVAYNLIMIPAAATGTLPVWLSGLGMALSSLFVLLNSQRIRGAAI